MRNNRKGSFMWTKENIKTVMTLWDTNTKEEICEKLGCRIAQLAYIATQIRKAGYKLTKKTSHGVLRGLIEEAMTEIEQSR